MTDNDNTPDITSKDLTIHHSYQNPTAERIIKTMIKIPGWRECHLRPSKRLNAIFVSNVVSAFDRICKDEDKFQVVERNKYCFSFSIDGKISKFMCMTENEYKNIVVRYVNSTLLKPTLVAGY
jgi:hypothetical protein